MENTNGTNQGGDLLFANKPTNWKNAARELEEQEIYYALIYTSLRRRKGDEKCGYSMGWLQKRHTICPTKLDNRLFQSIQDIWRSYEAYRGNNEKLELTDGRKSLAEVKIQRGIFHGDALSLLLYIIVILPLNHMLRKCTGGYKLHKSQEKNQAPIAYGRYQIVSQKWKRIRNPYIQSGYWRCPWCNGYRRRKLTQRHEFKSWTRPIA